MNPNPLANPLNWLLAFPALALLFLLFGRRDRYAPYHHDLARAAGHELPTNQTRRITLNDAIQLSTLFIAPAAALAGYWLHELHLYGVALCAGAVWIATISHSFTENKQEAKRDGITLQDAHGGRWGFVLAMLLIVLIAAAVAAVLIVALGLTN